MPVDWFLLFPVVFVSFDFLFVSKSRLSLKKETLFSKFSLRETLSILTRKAFKSYYTFHSLSQGMTDIPELRRRTTLTYVFPIFFEKKNRMLIYLPLSLMRVKGQGNLVHLNIVVLWGWQRGFLCFLRFKHDSLYLSSVHDTSRSSSHSRKTRAWRKSRRVQSKSKKCWRKLELKNYILNMLFRGKLILQRILEKMKKKNFASDFFWIV